MRKKVVSSYNEWDPLEEVIVGTVKNSAKMAFEPALSPFYPMNSSQRQFKGSRVEQYEIDKAQEQLDILAAILMEQGVLVRRPDEMDFCKPVMTPDFAVPVQNSSACPRDVLLVIGNEIIEAPMAQRARYFEYRAYRSLIKEYFERGAKWTAAPKPMMSDELYTDNIAREKDTPNVKNHNFLTQFEPCFDAATFVRCGRDIFYQPDAVTNEFGAEWLQRHLGGEYRLHKIIFHDSRPEHLDTTLVPIRPGLVLINPERPCINDGINIFYENGWRVLEAPASFRSPLGYTPEVSNWISMNILCLDTNTVIVEQEEVQMIEFMKLLEYKVITCPFSEVYKFGGGFHCCTTDIRRRGELKSYFPLLDRK